MGESTHQCPDSKRRFQPSQRCSQTKVGTGTQGGHHLEALLVGVGSEQLIDHLLYPRPKGLHGPRSEGFVDESSKSRVVRGICDEHAGSLPFSPQEDLPETPTARSFAGVLTVARTPQDGVHVIMASDIPNV